MLKLAMTATSPAILILHYKDNPHTFACLDSLQRLARPVTVYILSVQSSQVEALAHHPSKPTVISTSKNGGFARGNNYLINKAIQRGHTHFVLLNNDTTVEPNFLEPLLKQLKSPTIGFVSPKIYFYPGNEFHHQSYSKSEQGKVIWYAGGLIDWAHVDASHWGVNEVDHGQFETPTETDFATGCCLAFTKKTLDKIGLMDEKYFLYYEDSDWSLRTQKHGLKIIFEPRSVIYHKNAGSTGGSGSSTQQYYQTRNRIYFGLKYAPLKTKLHLIKNALSDLKSPNATIRRASRDALTFHFGKLSW